ncbi:hypothetical protein LOAG_10993 [Loa loa]|uniref:Uncharacterized protein n=1 Tax=Loa loa TaxID=7209 RepID=A0A1S0TNU6_LOALO|nr:hypothetical protein LOAG_10993 [Loa loa]EFO17506.1 hypothetical protein LOAG_10993 [Loa loa]
MNLGNSLEPDYSQFGINFPAPAPSDYDQEGSVKLESLIPINNITTERTAPIETPLITLFPDEKEISSLNGKENLNVVSVIDVNENREKISRFGNRENSGRDGMNKSSSDDHEEEKDKNLELTEEKVGKLQRFVVLLRESNITENDLSELTRLLKQKKAINSKSVRSTTGSRILFTNPTASITTASTLQRTNETNKAFITALPIIFRHTEPEPGDVVDSEDSDLLPFTTSRPKMGAVRIKYQSRNQQKTNSTSAIFHRPRKYPRRTAYRARLPFVTSATHIEAKMEKPKQSKINMNGGAIQQIHLTEQKSDVLRQQFLQPAVLNPFAQSEVTAPAFGIFRTPTFPSPLISKLRMSLEPTLHLYPF